MVLCCADLVFWDMPYGLGLAPWDSALLTDIELETFFQQLAVVNRARQHCLVLSCVWHDAGRLRKFMMENAYSDIHPLYVYKPMQNTTGMEWIFAVEIMIVGYKGGIRGCNLTFSDMNPLTRHNLILGHQVGSKIKHVGEDVEVNTTQKNPNTASTIGRIMCKPGAYALVIGAGSGSEVLGLARVGVNVVGIERDSKQFMSLTQRITSEAAFPKHALTRLAEDDRSVALLGRLASKFTKLAPDVTVHFAEAEEGQQLEDDGGQVDKANISVGDAHSKTCPACGEGVGQLDSCACAKGQCVSGLLHLSCVVTCSKCGGKFCSEPCKEDHGCM